MKNIKIIVPAFIAIIFVFFLYTNITRNVEISNIENHLTELRLLSNDLKESFTSNNRVLKELQVNTNNDFFVLSNKKYSQDMDNYLDTLANLEYERLYSLHKILKSKTSMLENIYEDIKTDTAGMKNSIDWSKKAYKKYMKNKRRLSAEDRNYLSHLFDVTIGSTETSAKDFKYITSLKNTDLLNKHLKMIYNKKVSIIDSYAQLNANDVRHEINEIIKYSHSVSKKLRKESSVIVGNLLYMSLVLLVLAIVIYIKELRDAKELRKTKNELDEFFNALNKSSIVSKSDLSGNITYANDKFCEISGYSRDELIGKPHSLVRHSSMDSKVFKALWETIQANKIFKGVVKNRKKDGSIYIVDTTIIPIHDENGKIIEYLSVRHDLTHTLHMVL